MQTECDVPPDLAPSTDMLEGDTGGYGLSLSQLDAHPVPKAWIILDTGSTINTFMNSNMLSNIRRAPKGITSLTNGGNTTYHLMGSFQDLFNAWFDPDGLANILSLAHLSAVCRVVYDSTDHASFVAHLPDGRVWTFEKSDNGLYYYDTASDPNFSNAELTNEM
jgi:hypothetical protein